MKLIVFAFILSFFSGTCTFNDRINLCKTEITTILNEPNRKKVFKVEQLIDHSGEEFKDIGKDCIEGGYYSFYKNGNLKFYRYFIDTTHFVYVIMYDSSGNFISDDGNPLIHKYANTKLNDSLKLSFYFSTLGKDYRKIIFGEGNIKTPLYMQADTLYSNIGVVSYSIPYPKNKTKIRGVLHVEYNISCDTRAVKSFANEVNIDIDPQTRGIILN